MKRGLGLAGAGLGGSGWVVRGIDAGFGVPAGVARNLLT